MNMKPTYQELIDRISQLEKERGSLISTNKEGGRFDSRYQKMISNIRDVIVIIDKDGVNRYKSPNIYDIFGWRPEELVGKNTFENLHPDCIDDAINFFKTLLKQSNSTGLRQYEYLCKDGSYKWIEINLCNLIHDKDIGGLLGSYHDITNRKKAEKSIIEHEKNIKESKEKLLRSENAYFRLLQNLDSGIVVHAPDTQIIYSNEKASELLGLTINQMMGKSAVDPTWSFIHEDHTLFNLEEYPIAIVLKTKKAIQNMVLGIKKPKINDVVWLLVNAFPEFDKDERLQQVVVTFNDISSRKQVELELIEAKERAEESESVYLKLIGEIPDGVYKSTHEGKFIEVNPAMVELLGYSSKEELLSVDIKEELYFDSSDRESLTLDAIQKELGVFRMRKKDGSEIWVEDHGWYTLDDSSNILYHEGVIRDVTDRIRAEQELLASKKKAEESDRLKSAFLANMSHEIRTPMNGILGFAELLKEPDLTGDQQQEYVEIITKGGARMLNIINDIVDISRIESNLVNLSTSEANINKKIEYIHAFFKIEAKQKQIKLEYKTPLKSSEANVIIDREKIYAILTNLVKNAIKFTHDGTIELGYNKKDNYLEFYVKDTGIGIPKDRQGAIFERFIQADLDDKNAYQGAGLGLSISKAYVEMMNGKIWVESEVGSGSRFYFTIPYIVVANETREDITESVIDSNPDIINVQKVLLVEDDETSMDFLKILMEDVSPNILEAINGVEAIEISNKNPDIELILMDMKMPIMDGYKATKEIRSKNKDVIIIAQTAYGLAGDRKKAIEAGCNDYISKPIIKNDLLSMFQKYFHK